MNSKKLVKVIKTLVEAEVAKKHESFMKKTFPKILEEAVNTKIKNMGGKNNLAYLSLLFLIVQLFH